MLSVSESVREPLSDSIRSRRVFASAGLGREECSWVTPNQRRAMQTQGSQRPVPSGLIPAGPAAALRGLTVAGYGASPRRLAAKPAGTQTRPDRINQRFIQSLICRPPAVGKRDDRLTRERDATSRRTAGSRAVIGRPGERFSEIRCIASRVKRDIGHLQAACTVLRSVSRAAQ